MTRQEERGEIEPQPQVERELGGGKDLSAAIASFQAERDTFIAAVNAAGAFNAKVAARVIELERERDEARAQWRCFHCDEVFTDHKAAYDHFGDGESCQEEHAACVDPLRHDEKQRITELREAQDYAFRQQERANAAEDRMEEMRSDIARLIPGAATVDDVAHKYEEMEGRALTYEAAQVEILTDLQLMIVERGVTVEDGPESVASWLARCVDATKEAAGRDRAAAELKRVRAVMTSTFGGRGPGSTIWGHTQWDKGYSAGVLAALNAFDDAARRKLESEDRRDG